MSQSDKVREKQGLKPWKVNSLVIQSCHMTFNAQWTFALKWEEALGRETTSLTMRTVTDCCTFETPEISWSQNFYMGQYLLRTLDRTKRGDLGKMRLSAYNYTQLVVR